MTLQTTRKRTHQAYKHKKLSVIQQQILPILLPAAFDSKVDFQQ
jgi:hypothetical protein